MVNVDHLVLCPRRSNSFYGVVCASIYLLVNVLLLCSVWYISTCEVIFFFVSTSLFFHICLNIQSTIPVRNPQLFCFPCLQSLLFSFFPSSTLSMVSPLFSECFMYAFHACLALFHITFELFRLASARRQAQYLLIQFYEFLFTSSLDHLCSLSLTSSV